MCLTRHYAGSNITSLTQARPLATRKKADMTTNQITLHDIVGLAQFVSELVRQGVSFTVWSEDVSASSKPEIVWHVTLTGGF